MNSNSNTKDAFLISEYEFLQKAYEVQFNHFMGVFYFWVAVITAPITAGLVSEPKLEQTLGIICIAVASLGFFLSVKMFDIRKSQLRYTNKMNEIRGFFWRKYKIEERYLLIPLGKNTNLAKISKTDFGMYMALTMSLVHGGLFFVSLRLFYVSLFLSLLGGALLLLINVWLYFKFMKNLDRTNK